MENYFKIGDTVKCPSIWGDRMTFTVNGFSGNDYCPIAYVSMDGKPETNGNKCNIDIRDLVLVGARKRPMYSVAQTNLIKLIGKHVTEAKREFLIRKHSKC